MDDEKTPQQDESTEGQEPQADATEAQEPQAEAAEATPDDQSSEEVSEDPVAEEVTSPEADQEVEPSAAEEPPATEEPAAEEPAAEAPDPEAKEPAEKKKDVIPGADLEPILVEPDKPELSAEERARLEAEEEEKARREAALAEAEETDTPASRAPAEMEAGARFLATGKRKRSIARVTLVPGNGKIEINKRDLEEFFPRPLHQTMVKQPLAVSGYEGNVDVRVRVHGGGISGQAGAVRHGIARALTEIDSELRGDLKRRGFLTRDARVKERYKAGLKKARKRPQFSKR
jgi:small subunit ribosomal protein S9